MTFADFAETLKVNIDPEAKDSDFFMIIFDTYIQEEPVSESREKGKKSIRGDQKRRKAQSSWNPFDSVSKDAQERMFRGKRPFSKDKLKKVYSRRDDHRFASFIKAQSEEVRVHIRKDLRLLESHFDEEDNIGYACQDWLTEFIQNEIQKPEPVQNRIQKTSVSSMPNTLESTSDEDIDRALEYLQRKQQQNRFRTIEARDSDGGVRLFRESLLPKDKKSESLSSSIAEYCIQNSPLFVYGSGGSGKTTFLQLALSRLHSQYRCRFLHFDRLYQLVQENQFQEEEDLKHFFSDAEIVFLDAINEMTPNGFDRSDHVTGKVCSMLGAFCQNCGNTKIILTGAFSDETEAASVMELMGVELSTLHLRGIPGDNQNLIRVSRAVGENLSELLRRPLYFNAFFSTAQKKRDKAANRYDVIGLLYEQMCRRGRRKKTYGPGFETIVDRLLPKYAYRNIFDSYRKQFSAAEVGPDFDAVAPYLDAMLQKHITADNRILYSFAHQEYRDYLAALYFHRVVQDLQSGTPMDIVDLNFDPLPNSTVEMLVEGATGLVITPDDFDGHMENTQFQADWWKPFEVLGRDFNTTRSTMAIGFEISYYLGDPVRHPNTRKNVYYPGYRSLIASYFKTAQEQVFCPFPVEEYIQWGRVIDKVVYKHLELFRRAGDYDEGLACFDEIVDYLEDEANAGLYFQKARLLMDRGLRNQSAKDFQNGFQLLRSVAEDGSVVSANNLLGRIYASPTSSVLRFLGPEIRNQKQGFLCFYNSVLTDLRKGFLNLFGKYAFVRCAKMLIFSQVQVTSHRSITPENIFYAQERQVPPSQLNLRYAENFLQQSQSTTPYAFCLRGIIQYYHADYNTAAETFRRVLERERGFGRIIPSLFRYQAILNGGQSDEAGESLDLALFKQVYELKQLIQYGMISDNYDSYHPQYLLEDIEYALLCLPDAQDALARLERDQLASV